MNPPSRHQLLHGGMHPLPERIPLRAGPLTLCFEEGSLLYVRLGDKEILRRIYVAVRDENWATIPLRITSLEMERDDASFRIGFFVSHRRGEIDFAWKGSIRGRADGSIDYRMEGEARSSFLRNRIGICVLHPARECAGAPCAVERTDGTREEAAFPILIAPHQPFKDIRAITHKVQPGLGVRVEFRGDVFEMEDQRNWTDASFKTYSTPLDLPIPVKVERGTRITQSVHLTLEGAAGEDVPHRRLPALRLASAPAVRLPDIGLGQASHGSAFSPAEIRRLRPLRLSHLRVDLRLSQPSWMEDWERACRDAAALDAQVEAALFLSGDAEQELEALCGKLSGGRTRVKSWLVFHENERSTGAEWIGLARRFLAAAERALVGAGTNSYFTEVNRSRPPLELLDLVCYSANPQVHAFDCATLVENLEGLRSTIENARLFSADLALAITPVTLKPRFRVGTARPQPGELPMQVDPRQASLFGAGWTAGALGALARPGVASVTFFETTGWRGVMETEGGSPDGSGFGSIPGSVFPLYHVLADAAEYRGGWIAEMEPGDPLLLGGIALRQDSRLTILAASFSPERQNARLEGVPPRLRLRRLNEENAVLAMTDPEAYRAAPQQRLESADGVLEIELLPFEILRLDAE